MSSENQVQSDGDSGDSGWVAGNSGPGLAPIPAEPAPWVPQPKYGQYAVGGAPVAGDAPGGAPSYGAPQYGAPQYGSPQYGAPQYGAPQYGGQQVGTMPYAPAPPPPTQFADPKPGIVPLRPLRLGEIFGGAWSAIWHNPAVMLGLSLLIILAATLLSALLGLALSGPLERLNNELIDQSGINSLLREADFGDITVGSNWTLFTGASTAAGLLMAFVTPIVNGILAISVSQSILGKHISIRDAWDRVKGRIGALIGWSILMTLALIVAATLGALAIAGIVILAANVSEGFAVFLAFLLVIGLAVLFLWLAVKLLFVAPVIAIERCGIKQALNRSWELSKGHFWRILGIYLLGTLLISFISGMITAPLALLSGGLTFGTGSVGAPFLLELIRLVVSNGISLIFTSGLLTLLYIDSRTRTEGLHNSLIAATGKDASY